jgi:hypothetical protein
MSRFQTPIPVEDGHQNHHRPMARVDRTLAVMVTAVVEIATARANLVMAHRPTMTDRMAMTYQVAA